MVGRLSLVLKQQHENLEGRVGQVFEIFSRSQSRSKISFSNNNGGVVLAMLIDKYDSRDALLNGSLPDVESDIDSDEN